MTYDGSYLRPDESNQRPRPVFIEVLHKLRNGSNDFDSKGGTDIHSLNLYLCTMYISSCFSRVLTKSVLRTSMGTILI
jgi:hypothetical protein